MRLIVHNHLLDTNGNSYHIEDAETKVILKEYNESLIRQIIETVDFQVLKQAVHDLGIKINIYFDKGEVDEKDLQSLHHILFEIEVVKGFLVSQDKKKYQIIAGIPDMETEVV